MIIETFRENGVAIDEFCSGRYCKERPDDNADYADVINAHSYRRLRSGGAGLCIFGAVAGNGYENVYQAAEVMGKVLTRL